MSNVIQFPAPETNLDIKTRKQFIENLKKRGAVFPCSRCGSTKYSLDGYLGLPIVCDLSGEKNGIIPTIIITCNNCGYLHFHAAQMLGLSLTQPSTFQETHNEPHKKKKGEKMMNKIMEGFRQKPVHTQFKYIIQLATAGGSFGTLSIYNCMRFVETWDYTNLCISIITLFMAFLCNYLTWEIVFLIHKEINHLAMENTKLRKQIL